MTKIQIFVLSLIVFFSVQAYSGMEQTQKCYKEISTLQSKIKSIDEEIKKAESSIFIPRPVREKKIRDLEKQKEDKQDKLINEINRLHTCKSITIKRIEIKSVGDWDAFLGPEIIVLLGNKTIARGSQDSYDLFASSLSEDATNHDSLYVYDEDPKENDYMGEIPLEEIKLLKGVSGDVGLHTVKGSKGSQSRGFSYTVEYEVEF